MEPTALLIIEALGKIGITSSSKDIRGPSVADGLRWWKSGAAHLEGFAAGLNYPCY
jgi:hypothetical protein